MEELICKYQYNHLAITQPEGKITPCCHFDNSSNSHWDSVNLKNQKTLDNILKSYRWYDLREMFSENIKFDGCKNCWNAERIGYKSKREYYNQLCIDDNYHAPILEDLEIALDFNCNFMCRSCRPGVSSKWNQATDVIENLREFEKDHYNPLTVEKFSEKFKNIILKTDLTNLKRIAIVGGEPFLSYNLKWFLRKINLENIQIKITTNGSIFPDQELLELLNRSKTVFLDISIDAVGDLAEVIRFGTSWEKIVENLEKFIKTKFIIKLVTTVSIMNINKLKNIINFARTYNLPQTCYSLYWPSHLRLNILPVDIRKKWKINLPEKLNKIFFMGHEYAYDDVKDFNTIIMDEKQCENRLLEFVKTMILLDQYQKKKFSDVNSEIWEIAHTCKRVKKYYNIT